MTSQSLRSNAWTSSTKDALRFFFQLSFWSLLSVAMAAYIVFPVDGTLTHAVHSLQEGGEGLKKAVAQDFCGDHRNLTSPHQRDAHACKRGILRLTAERTELFVDPVAFPRGSGLAGDPHRFFLFSCITPQLRRQRPQGSSRKNQRAFYKVQMGCGKTIDNRGVDIVTIQVLVEVQSYGGNAWRE